MRKVSCAIFLWLILIMGCLKEETKKFELISTHSESGTIFNGIDCYRDILYVATTGNSPGLKIYQIQDEVNLGLISHSNIPGGLEDVQKEGDLIFAVSSESPGFQIIDISNITNPEVIASIDEISGAVDIDLEWQYAYVSTGEDGLFIIDRTDETNPNIAAHLTEPCNATIAWGNNIFTCNDSIFKVWDVSDVSNIDCISEITSGYGITRDIAANGEYVYICLEYIPESGYPDSSYSNYEGEVMKINYSYPNSPYFSGIFYTKGIPLCAELSLGSIYVSEGGSNPGFSRDGSFFIGDGYCELPGPGYDFDYWGEFAYIAGGSAGIYIVRIVEE